MVIKYSFGKKVLKFSITFLFLNISFLLLSISAYNVTWYHKCVTNTSEAVLVKCAVVTSTSLFSDLGSHSSTSIFFIIPVQ